MNDPSGAAVCPEFSAHRQEGALRRAQQGDTKGFEDLIGALSPRLSAFADRFLSGDWESASAAVQDAWTQAWQQIRRFESEEHLVRWLHRVARCGAISHLRRNRRLVPMSWGDLGAEEPTVPEPEARDHATEDPEMREAAHAALASLPDAHRGIATLYYLHGQNLREVAQLVRLPVSTVKMRLHRARQRLRRSLRRARPS